MKTKKSTWWKEHWAAFLYGFSHLSAFISPAIFLALIWFNEFLSEMEKKSVNLNTGQTEFGAKTFEKVNGNQNCHFGRNCG